MPLEFAKLPNRNRIEKQGQTHDARVSVYIYIYKYIQIMIYFKISFSFLWTPMSLLIAQSVKHTKIGNLREFSQDDGRLPFLGLLPFKGESRGPKRPGFCWIGKWEVTPCTPNNCIDIIEIFIERLAYIIYDIYGYATMWKCAIRSHGRKQQRQRRGIITNLLIRSYI